MYYTITYGLCGLVGSFVFCKVFDITLNEQSGTFKFFPTPGAVLVTACTLGCMIFGFAYGSRALIDGTHPVQTLLK